MDIEMYCVRGVRHLAEAYSFGFLRDRYPQHYQVIRTELDSEWPSKEAERQADWNRKVEELIAKQAKAEEKAKEREERDEVKWQQLGGKLT